MPKMASTERSTVTYPMGGVVASPLSRPRVLMASPRTMSMATYLFSLWLMFSSWAHLRVGSIRGACVWGKVCDPWPRALDALAMAKSPLAISLVVTKGSKQTKEKKSESSILEGRSRADESTTKFETMCGRFMSAHRMCHVVNPKKFWVTHAAG